MDLVNMRKLVKYDESLEEETLRVEMFPENLFGSEPMRADEALSHLSPWKRDEIVDLD